MQARQTELQTARSQLTAAEKALNARLVPNRNAAAQYRQHSARLTALEHRWQWVSALSATAGGTLSSKQKIRLEAYIQMNYLDRILVHANTRLMQMTAGQYELERIGAENQRSQSGPPQREDPFRRRELQGLSGAGPGPFRRGAERRWRHPAGHPFPRRGLWLPG